MKGIEVILNGVKYNIAAKQLSYAQIVNLTGSQSVSDPFGWTITVSYRRPSSRRGLTLIPGHVADVDNGMIINCTKTNNA